MADVWLLHDRGKIGSRHQCIGLAEALKVSYHIKEVDVPNIYAAGPYVLFERLMRSMHVFERYGLEKPWPRLILASGRKSVSLAARLKRLNNDQTQVVILQKPTHNLHAFDLVLCPQHDQCTKAPHVIATLGSLHHLTLMKLEEARLMHPEPMGKRPWIVVLLGAPPQDRTCIRRMIQDLEGWRYCEGQDSILRIMASRRTPLSVVHAIRESFGSQVDLWDPSSQVPNPYLASLAYADQIVVTGDSVNMLTESCFTGKPVYIWSLGDDRAKFQRFHQSLINAGHAQWATPILSPFDAQPVREIDRIIHQVSVILKR